MPRHAPTRRPAGHVAAIAALLLAAACSGSASAEFPDVLPTMLDEIRAMPGYELEPATFDRYAKAAHADACLAAFPGGAGVAEDAAWQKYRVEIHRLMLDRAFTEGRTDLADVLTRAYIAAQGGE